MMNKVFYLSIYFILMVLQGFGQPTYDNCNNPYTIPDVTNYCSKVGEFTNIDATPSGYGPATCWSFTNRDVWFRFRAFFTDVNITVIGTNIGGRSGGTLTRPMVALYKGICGGTISELRCAADVGSRGITSIYQGGLIVGADYFIRIDGVTNATGTFQICINNFNPPAQAEQDCPKATVLCDKSSFVVQKVSGGGLDSDEANNSCLGDNSTQNSESSSVWYTWQAANNGTLTFVLNPINPSDDIDFAVYELPNGIHNCNNKFVLRCNATAPPCAGPTGLNMTDTDLVEDLNCNSGENGFCKFIDMEQGKAYALIVNNFSNTGIGFSVEWGGTGEFAGPIANFGIDPPSGLKCETDFTVIDSSMSTPFSNIVRWNWNFGVDAIPQTGVGNQIQTVRYNSIGEKYVTLTIQSSNGCQLTEIRRILVEPCCEDLPTLQIRVDSSRNLRCHNSNDGMIAVNGNQGSPFDEDINGIKIFYYQYSLDGRNYSPNNLFTNLSAGTYKLFIQDRKGCLDSISITLTEPPPVIPYAGSDIEIDLGDYINLDATVNPNDFYNYEWYRGDSIGCKTCQNTSALPFNDGYYAIRTTNSNGCVGVDSFFVRVRKNYVVYPPNVFSPNGDNINDIFHIFGGKSLLQIDELQIFDRWGNLLYLGKNLNPNNPASGWNGRSNDNPCNPGVYVYLVKARFLDGHIETIGGDLTLMR
jgi:gliding motility-associated-like protein